MSSYTTACIILHFMKQTAFSAFHPQFWFLALTLAFGLSPLLFHHSSMWQMLGLTFLDQIITLINLTVAKKNDRKIVNFLHALLALAHPHKTITLLLALEIGACTESGVLAIDCGHAALLWGRYDAEWTFPVYLSCIECTAFISHTSVLD